MLLDYYTRTLLDQKLVKANKLSNKELPLFHKGVFAKPACSKQLVQFKPLVGVKDVSQALHCLHT